MSTTKGFIKDYSGNRLLPITRGELVLDSKGQIALFSDEFIATTEHPGLMTAAEKAMLAGTNGGQNLSDIYTKLGYINSGIKVGETVLHFYTEDGSDSIVINSVKDQTVVSVANNVISIGLAKLTVAKPEAATIIRNITVDDYGRVTEIEGSGLTNNDIPDTLTGKTLTNCLASDLSGDTISDQAIVNKKYLDTRLNIVTSAATGALIFKNGISSTNYTEKLTNASENWYYKATDNFSLTSTQTDTGESVNIKPGDTLIVLKKDGVNVFVHVPSGDDITTITVQNNGTDVLSSLQGNVKLNFSSLFDVSGDDQTAGLSIKQANETQDGYLSASDWNRFNNYASKTVSYTSTTTESDVVSYKIGDLIYGDSTTAIYGKYNVSSLSLENGSNVDNPTYNPVLKFTETGTNDVNITYEGINGISVIKDSNTIKFTANNIVADGSKTYLSIADGYKFAVKLADITNATDGLVSLSLVTSLITSSTHTFESFSYSLNGESSDTEYRYGNQKLIEAIDITI